jgi:chromosome segregation ATPase
VSDKHLLEGLEVKVAFGSQWKESLSELSGGQRSLVALSLILALLRYKPAPMYILDEVDSALDLSHTQNIGRMLKTHFSDSQFIVVSLKVVSFHDSEDFTLIDAFFFFTSRKACLTMPTSFLKLLSLTECPR